MRFARNFTLLRKEMGLTQEKMAEKCGVSRTALAKWERGITIPDVYMIDNIARIFNVTLDELVRGGMDSILDEKEEIYRKIEEMKEEILLEIRNNKKSNDLDLFEEYCTYLNGHEMTDEDIPVDAYSYWGCEEAEKGNYEEAIKLFEVALAHGDIHVVDYIMSIYADVINMYSNEREESKYLEWRLEQAKKMQQYGKILEMAILNGRVV